jgi:sigma-B regulation protein RsbU (phosphoserine phosphatase)
MSALMQGMFAAQAHHTEGPAPIVANINKALCRRGLESRFVTLMFGIMTAEGSLTYCNAGHNPPFIIGTAGVRRLEAGGPVVGLLPFAPYEQESVQLDVGDTIVVFSDGVSEALSSSGEEWGDDRLLAAVQAAGPGSAQFLIERLVAAVREFTRGAAQSDDITAMVIRYLGVPA